MPDIERIAYVWDGDWALRVRPSRRDPGTWELASVYGDGRGGEEIDTTIHCIEPEVLRALAVEVLRIVEVVDDAA